MKISFSIFVLTSSLESIGCFMCYLLNTINVYIDKKNTAANSVTLSCGPLITPPYISVIDNNLSRQKCN